MKERTFTEELLDLLQKQSFYAGKLSAIAEIDDKVARVYLPEESEALRQPIYYHNNNGKEIIEAYNNQGYFVKTARKLVATKIETWNLIRDYAYQFGAPTDDQIESFWISPKGNQGGKFGERVIEVIAREEDLQYEEVTEILDICKRLGLITELNEIHQIESIDFESLKSEDEEYDPIEEMMYGQCVEALQRLDAEYNDYATLINFYSNDNLNAFENVTDILSVLDKSFEKASRSKTLTK